MVFSDISADLLDHCRAAAAAEGLLDRCSFVLASADSLDGIADASVDVVTTRSVLIYVKDKAAALREFYRVLRSGGRISVYEPINVLMHDPDRFLGYDITPVRPLADSSRRCMSRSSRGVRIPCLISTNVTCTARRAGGVRRVSLELRVTVQNAKRPVRWDRALRMSGNPLVPTLGEVLTGCCAPEIAEFTAHVKPLVEAGAGQERLAVSYLAAARN